MSVWYADTSLNRIQRRSMDYVTCKNVMYSELPRRERHSDRKNGRKKRRIIQCPVYRAVQYHFHLYRLYQLINVNTIDLISEALKPVAKIHIPDSIAIFSGEISSPALQTESSERKMRPLIFLAFKLANTVQVREKFHLAERAELCSAVSRPAMRKYAHRRLTVSISMPLGASASGKPRWWPMTSVHDVYLDIFLFIHRDSLTIASRNRNDPSRSRHTFSGVPLFINANSYSSSLFLFAFFFRGFSFERPSLEAESSMPIVHTEHDQFASLCVT